MSSRAVWHLRIQRSGLAALAVFLLGASSCFGPPVVERLDLELLPGGRARVSSHVELAADEARNPRVAERLRTWRDDIAAGVDPWSRRFAELDAEQERLTWERRRGTLIAAERTALLDDLSSLERLFADSPVTMSFHREPGIGELTFLPGAGSRASRSEQREVERQIAAWSRNVSAYLRDVEALRRAAGGSGVRERELFAQFFDSPGHEELPPPQAEEQTILDRLDESTSAIAESLSVAEGEAETLDERTRRVFDPFPAPLIVVVRGSILEVEGFERREDGTVAVPGLNLWSALARLAERWPALAPFLHALEEPKEGEAEPEVDVDAFVASLADSAPAPDEHELRDALAHQLEPAEIYRVRWSFAP